MGDLIQLKDYRKSDPKNPLQGFCDTLSPVVPEQFLAQVGDFVESNGHTYRILNVDADFVTLSFFASDYPNYYIHLKAQDPFHVPLKHFYAHYHPETTKTYPRRSTLVRIGARIRSALERLGSRSSP